MRMLQVKNASCMPVAPHFLVFTIVIECKNEDHVLLSLALKPLPAWPASCSRHWLTSTQEASHTEALPLRMY